MVSQQTHRPLQQRLIQFGVALCQWTARIRRDVTGSNLVRQLVRSALSPAANYAEARASESRRDFIHKLGVAVKELRETAVWLEAARQMGYGDPESRRLATECNELIAIFVASINTAKRNAP